MLSRSWSRLAWLVLALALAGAGYGGYRLLEARIALDVYRERLSALSADYEALRHRYNEAVRRTAVTELVVEDGRVSVAIRTAEGVVETLPTPFDASSEIYVDYVLVDGRLWIRRIFDDGTPPGNAVVIDPTWAQVDWDAAGAAHGKAAYRRLGEGRWVVSVSGDGSLGLARVDPDATVELSPPPSIGEYRPIEEELGAALAQLRPAEVLRSVARQLESVVR
jgi:hypothetical protein